ncbi:MAG TPA: DUF1080 domain-containing protein [Bacteroidales bacterium]|nr:DUF1080 domain-containing protein [Bacteroidales bacterium]
MKKKVLLYASMISVVLLLTPGLLSAQGKDKKHKSHKKDKSDRIMLFNGRDLQNWVFKLKDPAVDPGKVFTVKDGVIHIAGTPFGYMRTKGTYSDYQLHVEYRWPSEPTNSGVFLNVQEPDTIWPECFECQLQAGNAGDMICMNGADMAEHTDKSNIVIHKFEASSEKPAGEWNKLKIICKDDIIEIYVNGVLQNRATKVNITSGHICLQSEGKEIEFRDVYLKKLKE